MDQGSSMFLVKKKKIIDQIANILISALQKELLTLDEGQVIAKYVLENTKTATSEQDLINFLQDLSSHWELFQKVSQTNREAVRLEQKVDQTISADQEKIESIKKQLSSLSKDSN